MKEVIKNPEIILFIVVVSVFLLSKVGLKLNYLSVWDIIKNHINCFRNPRTKKLLIIPIFDYFLMPFLLGIIAAFIKIIDSSVVNIITIIVSILTSMFFTLLGMLIDMKLKVNEDKNYYSTEAKISKQSLIETYYAVMFEILVSIILLILCLFNVFTSCFSFAQSTLIYGLAFLLIINLMMIIKRIFKIIDTDMQK
jgi:hypothetical protein